MSTYWILMAVGCVGIAVAGMAVLNWLFYLDITRSGWRAAAEELPRFAEAHGLTFEPSSLAHEMGEVHGTYEGHAIRLEPDSNAKIEVALSTRPELLLGTYSPRQASVPGGTVEFSSGSEDFDLFFPTRYASPQVAERLRSASALHEYVGSALRPWSRAMLFLEVGPAGIIRVSLKYGQASYLPPEVLDGLLPDLVQFARLLEDALGEKPSS